MKSDTEIKQEGLKILIEKLGEIEAEKFITLILRQPFDYTKWQKGLWKDKKIEELSKEAMDYKNKNNR